jgi:LacI family transcriptional regulator
MEAGNYLATELFDLAKPASMDNLERFFADSSIRAMVLLPPLCDYGPLKDCLRARDIKAVLISPMTPDAIYPSVSMDDRQAARDVTDYLLSIGHTKIAHIAGHPDHAAAFLRRQGYYEAFAARGLSRPPSDYVREGEFNFRSGILASEKLLTLPDRPTAIFASNDEMAAAACGVAHRMGLRIPEDLSVVGFDDAPIASAIWPALTTVPQPYVEMARKAVTLLNMEGERPGDPDAVARHLIPHSLIVRDSTARAM